MISSEVQRTLVKSPPELWAELSDPDALSRHLGALGDIRITRAEPEKLVEWETDGTSGSVQIKPSAWGTRVTLCVTRELVAAPPPATPEAAEDLAVTHVQEQGEEPILADADESIVADADESIVADAEEPVIADADEPILAQAEEPIVADADEPIEEPIEPYVDEPGVAHGEEPAIIEPDDQKTIVFMAVAEPEIADESRRGFFARLFGRLRARPEEGSQRPSGEPTRQPAAEPDAAPAGAKDTEERSPEADVAQDEGGLPSTAIESLQARFATEDPSPGEPIETVDVASEQAIEPSAVEPQPGGQAPVGTAMQTPPAPTAEGSPELAGAPGADLAAELKAAEEVAAEEVTAVLTAVLDRLGAAHHRPFSRS